MNAQRLLEHFDRLAEAPDAIPRLRRFILDLAVRGKLVEQDPNDEPAAELLKRIAAERGRLVKAGEIRKPKPLPSVDEKPFELARSWCWTRIREITSDRGQNVPDNRFTYIDVTAINKESGVVAEPKILEASEAPSRARKITKKGDVIYSCVRPYLLNVAVIDQDFEPEAIASTAFAVLNGYGLVVPRYLWIVLRSPFMVECVEESQRGQAYPAINDADFAVLPFPLPPLAEQHRIIAKVDELMALCDQLEAAQAEREQGRERLLSASLQRLNQPAEEDETFRQHARFVLDHLPRLTVRPEQIKSLRQTILNLAICGRLVPQDPANDRSNQSALRPDEEAEIYDKRAFQERAEQFSLPATWGIEPLSRISEHIVDCPHTTPKWTQTGVLCIRTNQVRAGSLDLTSPFFVSQETYQVRIERLEPRCDDLLYIREGGILGVGCRIPEGIRLCLGQRLMLIRANQSILPAFLELCINSPWITDFAAEKTTGGAAPRVNMSVVRGYPIPLPPLAEQHRIVAKVDELMAICDQLEAHLTTTHTDNRRLLEAVLHDALAPALADAA
jgi:type I restriction enzyme, S subunit